ncbi:DUF4402 domain-containing protein [Sphingomonas glaciei]|uniref:DUF4402 domain-containing protein n=1 Tax=Sphingomonas glaciei TaxID=2938948 RepID=A0ABY5MSY8_9SPHN|nr:DUF4402 domain-containing protein [Sphingomonas glaciei]UUR07268.1 DUF4402 domain-containing protein [Sphingomonas glaciei]
MRTFLTFAALAATTAFATPAFAQASLPSNSSDTIEATALLIQPATLQGIDNLDFGTLIASPAATGTVSINANDATSTRVFSVSAGTLTQGAGSALRGRLIGNGLPTQVVNISRTFPAVLVNQDDPTATMPFSGALNADAADGSVTIGATGVFYVYVGGTLTVSPNQMPGRYSGLVEVTAAFQ